MNRRKNVLGFFYVYLFSILLNLTNTKKMGLVDLKKVTVDCWIFLKGCSLSYILFGSSDPYKVHFAFVVVSWRPKSLIQKYLDFRPNWQRGFRCFTLYSKDIWFHFTNIKCDQCEIKSGRKVSFLLDYDKKRQKFQARFVSVYDG